MTQAICCQPLTSEARVYARSVHIGFLMDKVALGKYFIRVFQFFPCQYHYTVALHTHMSSGE
jgi:hypothetical protein